MPSLLAAAVHPLATTNAALNATATVLLATGYVLIKRRREQAHKWTMLAAFGVSVAFLACYLVYHLAIKGGVETPFQGQGWIRPVYFAMLISHILLAAAVPVLAIITIYYGLRDRRAKHRRLAVWTWPVWMYVSVTGVLVYLMLYHIYPQP